MFISEKFILKYLFIIIKVGIFLYVLNFEVKILFFFFYRLFLYYFFVLIVGYFFLL